MLITFVFFYLFAISSRLSYTRIITTPTRSFILNHIRLTWRTAQDGGVRRTDSDSDICINGEEDFGSTSSRHRNSVGRVSIRLVSDDRNIFLASYRNRD